MYNRVLAELQRQIPWATPRTILVDFEKGAMSAFSGAYPDATVTGCYFHLCQNVIRKVNEIRLKTEYETNDEIRCLPALAFVPNFLHSNFLLGRSQQLSIIWTS